MTVGGSSCPITSLTESALQCKPPETPKTVDGSGYSAVKVGSVEQIRRVFDDNSRIIFDSLWRKTYVVGTH